MWVCATPATQNAAASRAPKPRPSAPPSVICTTPATQNDGRCEFVPRMPRKTTVDVCVKLFYVKLLYVRDAMWQSCECVSVCERGGGRRRRRNPGYRIKNKNPTQSCGEKTTTPTSTAPPGAPAAAPTAPPPALAHTSTTSATITTITSSLHHLSASPSPSSALLPPPQPQPQRQRQPRQETRYVMRFRKGTSSSQKFRNKLSCKILEDTWGIWDPAVVWRSVCI